MGGVKFSKYLICARRFYCRLKFLALSSPKSRVFNMNVFGHKIMNGQSNRYFEIFNSALERATSAESAAYLDGACGDDAAMRARIETLLQAHGAAGGFLPSDEPKPPAAAPAKTIVMTPDMFPVTERPGDHIGRYKLLQKIGEGGCGVVYMAEQAEPVRRRIALKVIKLGMDTKSVIARFEAERHANLRPCSSGRPKSVITAGITAGIVESGRAAGGESIGGDGQPDGVGQVSAGFHHDIRVGGAGKVKSEITISKAGLIGLGIP
jgi:hypothetical protein